MDDAKAQYRSCAFIILIWRWWVVGRRDGREETYVVRLCGAAISADLGSSSNYSREIPNHLVRVILNRTQKVVFNLEGRSGEGFLVNGNQTRVSRS